MAKINSAAILLGITLFMLFCNAPPGSQKRITRDNLVTEGIPPIPEAIKSSLIRYQNTRWAVLADLDPAKRGMIITTRFGETSQVHYLSKPEGARQQLTFFEEPVIDATFCPDKTKNRFLFTRDVGGNENYQIFIFDMGTRKIKRLSDGKSRHGGVVWSNAGDQIAFFSTRRNGKDWDLYVSNADAPENVKRVLEKGGTWSPMRWSPDDKKLLVTNYVSRNESYFHILDLASGNLEQINPSSKEIAYEDATWSKNGKGIFLNSNEDTEFMVLRYYDIAKKTFTLISKAIPWNARELELSPDGRQLAFTTNENGFGSLYLMNTRTYRFKKVPSVPLGVIYKLRFFPDGKRLAFVCNTPKSPGDIFELELSTGKLLPWTISEVGGLDTRTFIAPGVIAYPTFDSVDNTQRTIPALYFRPETKKEKVPVLITLHGGPESQYWPYFSPTIQYYLNELNIAVIAPNVRGSSGYGKKYLKLDNGFLREGSVRDVGALLNWIDEQPELDASRIGVMGGSYGGYLALAAMVEYNERLRAGIDLVGISNFVTFLKNTKDYRRDLRRVEYGDERDPKMRAFLNRISPANNAKKITRPIFIVQGLNDPRVPASEAEQMLSAIKKNGGPVWYMLAKDEGHGFRKKKNRDFYTNAAAFFLKTYLTE